MTKDKVISNVGSYAHIKGLEIYRLPCTCYSVFQFPCTPRSFTAEDSQKSARCLKHEQFSSSQPIFKSLIWDLDILGYIHTLLYVWKSCRCSKHWLYKGDVDHKTVLLWSRLSKADTTWSYWEDTWGTFALNDFLWLWNKRGQGISLICMTLTNLIILNSNTQIYLFLYLPACQNYLQTECT